MYTVKEEIILVVFLSSTQAGKRRGRGWETRTVSETSRNLDSSWQEVRSRVSQCTEWTIQLLMICLPVSIAIFCTAFSSFSAGLLPFFLHLPPCSGEAPLFPGWGGGGWDVSEPRDWFRMVQDLSQVSQHEVQDSLGKKKKHSLCTWGCGGYTAGPECH